MIVIDDGSKDGTYRAVEDMQKNNAKLKLIKNGNLPEGWIGKNYAIHLGMKEAGGEWLLFLDADTELYPDAMSKVLSFSLSNNINMVSFSPEQVLRGFWESAVQPVIYEFLSYRYNYNWINSPNADAAAANGQFILIQRSVYEDAGGHETIRDKILEDVSLAENVKKKGFKIYFSYGREIVRCRMYKSLREIVQGWTKNLFTLLGYDFKTLFKIVLHLIFFSLFIAFDFHRARIYKWFIFDCNFMSSVSYCCHKVEEIRRIEISKCLSIFLPYRYRGFYYFVFTLSI